MEPINNSMEVNTQGFRRGGRVVVDGMSWIVTLPGAKTERRVAKAQKRLKLLEEKIEKNVATEDEYDECDKLEDFIFETLKGLFRDETKTNSQVNKWFDDTPIAIIMASFESIREQADKRDD